MRCRRGIHRQKRDEGGKKEREREKGERMRERRQSIRKGWDTEPFDARMRCVLVRSLCREGEDSKATAGGRMALLENGYSGRPRNSAKISRSMTVLS